MKLFSHFFRQKLKPAWLYTPDGNLWRILFSDSGSVVGEVRNHEKKATSFFCLDEDSGLPLWEDLKTDEPWWTGIETIHHGVVLFHGYEKPDLPEHKGIIAHDLATGRRLWRDDMVTFWFAQGSRVYSYKSMFDKKVAYALELNTGIVEETYESGVEDLFPLKNLARQEEQEHELLFPERFTGDLGFRGITDHVRAETRSQNIVGDIEYLVAEDCVVFNYHVAAANAAESGPKLQNYLCILDARDGTRLYSDILAREAPAPVPDSFFVKKGMVYYIRDRQTLVALNLRQDESRSL